MKKQSVIALILCLVMTALCGIGAIAEGTNEVNWADVEPTITEAGWQGEFVSFAEIAVKMYVPSTLTAVELTDEDREAGYIAYFQTEDQSAAVSVQYVNMDGMSAEEYKANLEATEGISQVQEGVINGLPAITYAIEETATSAVAMTTEMGYVLEIAFAPVTDEGFAAVSQIMAASLQAAE